MRHDDARLKCINTKVMHIKSLRTQEQLTYLWLLIRIIWYCAFNANFLSRSVYDDTSRSSYQAAHGE